MFKKFRKSLGEFINRLVRAASDLGVLLDDDFIEAYEWGIIIECIDGITRLCFPRIITYSADYPEKCAAFPIDG